MSYRSFSRLCFVFTLSVCSQTIFASDQLTITESDTIVKEDIAAAQILKQVCSNLIGQNAQLEQNINKLSQNFLQDMSDSNMSLEQLYKDPEYQNILDAAKKDALTVDQSEQKLACEEALNIES